MKTRILTEVVAWPGVVVALERGEEARVDANLPDRRNTVSNAELTVHAVRRL